MDLKTALARVVAEARKSRQLTQTQLAEQSGIDQGGISKIENGTRGLSFESLASIATALKLRGSQLLAMAEMCMEDRSPAFMGVKEEARTYRFDAGDSEALQLVVLALVQGLVRHAPAVAAEAGAQLQGIADATRSLSTHSWGSGILEALTDPELTQRAVQSLPSASQRPGASNR